MRATSAVILLLVLSGILQAETKPEQKPRKPAASATESPVGFARASAQAASVDKQRDAIEKQRASLGIPKPDTSFFLLPGIFNTPADSSFFILSDK